jgi:RNA polymerase sigma factor (sigma-70 family)
MRLIFVKERPVVQPNVMAVCRPEALPLASFRGSIAGSMIELGRRMATAETQQAGSDSVRRSALMAAAQAGDATAYATLLRDSVPLIKQAARRQGVPADRVDDVVQDVLLTIHRARATYDPKRPFDAWLRVIAERRAIDLLRQTRRQDAREINAPLAFESYADHAADPAQGLEHADAAGRVDKALATLPAGQREAVQTLVLEERSLEEAAAATNRSKGALKVNLHRALKALRGRINRGA